MAFNLSHWSQSGSYSNKKGLGKENEAHCSLSQERILREEQDEIQRVNPCKISKNQELERGMNFKEFVQVDWHESQGDCIALNAANRTTLNVVYTIHTT